MKLFIITLGLLSAISVYPESATDEIGVSAASVRIKGQALEQKTLEMNQAGIKLPIELYPTIRFASHALASDNPLVLSKLSHRLDGYSQELNMLSTSPGSLGTTELIMAESVHAGDKVEISQIYTVGTSLEVGAGILVAKHWQHDIRMQSSNRDAPNFISASSSDPGTLFKYGRIKWKGVHGSRYGLAELIFIEIIEGNLIEGDTITISYGTPGNKFELPEIVSRHASLPLYLRTQPMGPFFTIPVQEFEVIANKPARLVVLAPSILKSNHLFDLTIRAEDIFGNLAHGIAPQLEVIVDGVFQRRVQLPVNNVVVLAGLKFDLEGLHQITVRSGGGGLVGQSNPILVDNNLGIEILWANLHQHSNESDGIQSPEEINYESAGLYDVSLVADHDNYRPVNYIVPEIVPEEIIELPRVVSLPLARGGHHVVIPAGSLPGEVAAGGKSIVIALPEVPPNHRGLGDPVLVEIHSGSSSHEWLGQYFSNLGYRVGFSASRTSHLPARNLNQGQTAILLSNEDELNAAIQSRHTYASTGPRSILLVDVNGHLPGSRIPLQDHRRITGDIYSTSAIDTVELIRNGMVIDEYRPPLDEDMLQVKVTLGSESKPVVPGWDLPRNGREWLGYLRVHGAKISAVSAPGYEDRKRSAISLNPAGSGRIDFITWTHGSESSFTITLEELSGEDVSLELSIKEGFEDVDLMPDNRKPSETRAIHQIITLADIIEGGIKRTIDVNGYDDFVRFELANTGNASKVSFSFTDTRKMGIDDYYYVKVNQADDHTLWSSPVHIGGFDFE